MVYAATGASPFGADTVPAVLHRVLHAEPDLTPLPPRLREMIASCLAKDASRRPTAQQLMVSLVNPNTTPAPAARGPVPSGGAGAHGSAVHGAGAALGPHGGPPGGVHTGPRQPITTSPGRRSRSRGVLVGAVTAVVAAAATAVFMLNRTPATTGERQSPSAIAEMGQSPSAGTDTGQSPSATRSSAEETSSGTTRTQPADAEVKIPAAFEGDWSGRTTSTNPFDGDGAENSVAMKKGETTASWWERNADGECKGTIALTRVEGPQLTFSLGQNEGNCIAGTIWLALKGDTLTYTWKDVPGPGLVTQTGSLSKNS
jgi:hypothetical protein